MARVNAFGQRIGEIVDFDRAQLTTQKYNAAVVAHIAAHKPTTVDYWGDVIASPQGGYHEGHDLSVVYPVLGQVGVSYVEFDTGVVNNQVTAPIIATEEAQTSDSHRAPWWRY